MRDFIFRWNRIGQIVMVMFRKTFSIKAEIKRLNSTFIKISNLSLQQKILLLSLSKLKKYSNNTSCINKLVKHHLLTIHTKQKSIIAVTCN